MTIHPYILIVNLRYNHPMNLYTCPLIGVSAPMRPSIAADFLELKPSASVEAMSTTAICIIAFDFGNFTGLQS